MEPDSRSGAYQDDHGEASHEGSHEAVERIVAQGPHGAIAVAGVASAVVLAIWIGFYFFVFLPRGVVH